jgi:hypothetical protein
MVEEVLVRQNLSSQEISCGEELLHRIEDKGMKITAAYWVRDRTAEVPSWTLDIVTREVDKEGPLYVYEKIQKSITTSPRIGCGLDLNIIEVLGLEYSFFKQLRAAIRSKAYLINTPLSELVVGNTLVDLFIYKFPAANGRHQ